MIYVNIRKITFDNKLYLYRTARISKKNHRFREAAKYLFF